MLVYVMLAVFIGGLMVGRTPEWLGKKITATEMRLVALYVLVLPIIVLAGTAASVLIPSARRSMLNAGQPRLHRGSLRLRLSGERQRLGIRGAQRQHRLVQHNARPGDARRSLPANRCRAGSRRIALPGTHSRTDLGDDADLWPDVRHAAHRHRCRRSAASPTCQRSSSDRSPSTCSSDAETDQA